MKVQFPKPTGRYAVGTFTYTIKDHRKEVLPAGGMRSIAARVYYPVTKESVEAIKYSIDAVAKMINALSNSYEEKLEAQASTKQLNK